MLNHEEFHPISAKPQRFCHINSELQMVLSNVWRTSRGSVIQLWNPGNFSHIDAELKGFWRTIRDLTIPIPYWYCYIPSIPYKITFQPITIFALLNRMLISDQRSPKSI